MLLDIGYGQADRTPANPLPSTPRDFWERLGLDLEAFQRTDQFFSREQNLYEEYERAGEAIARVTGTRPQNPMALPDIEPSEVDAAAGMFVVGAGLSRRQAREAWAAAVRQWRQQYPDRAGELLDPDAIERAAGERAKAAADAARQAGLVPTLGGELGAFVGSAAGALTDPVQLATLPFGAPARLGGSAAARILYQALIEGGIAGGTQALVETRAAPYRAEIGVDGDPIANIVAAATGGAVVGGGLRGLVEGYRHLFGNVARPLPERDALAVAERALLDVESNPRPFDPAWDHGRAIEAATRAVVRAEPLSIADALRSGTAIGRALESTAPAPVRLDAEAIRLAPAPTADEIARRLAPDLFARVDRITERMDRLRAWLDDLRARRVAEIEAQYAPRLADLESRMARASAKNRARLSREADALRAERDAAIAAARATDSPDMARVRQELTRLDIERRDLATETSAVMARAERKAAAAAERRSKLESALRQAREVPGAEALRGARDDLAALNRAAAAGLIDDALDPFDGIAAALADIAAARRAGVSVAERLAAGDMDAGNPFLALFLDGPGLSTLAKPDRVAARLRGYVEEALRSPGAADAPVRFDLAAQRAQIARQARESMETISRPEVADAALAEAQRIAARIDPEVTLPDGRTVKASDALEAIEEQQRAAKEAAACMLGMAAE